MKKCLSLLLVLLMALSVMPAIAEETNDHFTDEMKIPYTVDLSEPDGSDAFERAGDHPDSPYFSRVDFYNAKSTDTLTILEQFKTQQQTSEWSCGVSSALMMLNYFDALGDHNEETLAAFRKESPSTGKSGTEPSATSLKQMIDIFEGVGGFDLTTTFDLENVYEEFTLATIQEYLKQGLPVAVGWNDWGGHWQVVIGYDTMGTETEQDDVLIVADPYDATDHNQDGYGVYPALRFIYNFTFYNFFEEEDLNAYCFLVAKPKPE